MHVYGVGRNCVRHYSCHPLASFHSEPRRFFPLPAAKQRARMYRSVRTFLFHWPERRSRQRRRWRERRPSPSETPAATVRHNRGKGKQDKSTTQPMNHLKVTIGLKHTQETACVDVTRHIRSLYKRLKIARATQFYLLSLVTRKERQLMQRSVDVKRHLTHVCHTCDNNNRDGIMKGTHLSHSSFWLSNVLAQ